CRAQERHERRMRAVAVQIADRRPVGFGEPAVESSRGPLERLADLAVGVYIAARQRRDLQERHLALVVREGLEKVLEGCAALRQPLAVVEPIDSDDQLAPEEAGG